MDKQPVGQLPDLTQSNNDDEIMVITNSEYNQLKKEKISDFITDLTSTNENNALTKGTDNKLFVTDFGNADNIINGTIDTERLPNSGVTAGKYIYPTNMQVNSKGQILSVENGVTADITKEQIDTVAARPLSDNACTQENFPDEYSYWVEQAHSTFDLSKFEVVGSPTISEDGILTPTSLNYVYFTGLNLYNASSWKIKGSFIAAQGDNTVDVIFSAADNINGFGIQFYVNTQNYYTFQGSTNSTSWLWTNNINSSNFQNNTKYYYVIEYTGTKYNLNISTDDIEYTTISSYTTSDKISALTSTITYNIGSSKDADRAWDKPIDLKDYAVWSDGQLVFSGNQTGIDTINDTLEIPYTATTDGTKVVDVAYFDRVQSCREQTGQALYLTLDEQNQAYYLPQGTVSGMISQNKQGLEDVEANLTARIEQIKAQIGFTLFDTKITDHVLSGNDAVGWALQGSLVTNIYTDAVSNIASAYASGTATTYREISCKRATDGRYIADISQKDAIDDLFDETGVADFYIYDSANSQFYLPKSKWFSQLTADSDLVNQYNASALPNITAAGTGSAVGGQSQIGGAAFNSGVNFERWQGGNRDSKRIDFNASRSSSVYKTGQTEVQPPSSNKLLYYKVGDTLTNDTAIDIGNMSNIISNLSTKTQIDDAMINGSSGYILLSNNTLIQWGNSGTAGTTNLLKSYANTNYIILTGQYNGPEKGLYASRFCTHSKTTTSFSWKIETMGNYWLAIGQGATS